MAVRFAEDIDAGSELFCSEKPLYSPVMWSNDGANRHVSTPFNADNNVVKDIRSISVPAANDRLLQDVRVVRNMLQTEHRYSMPSSRNYLSSVTTSTNVSENMRKVLLTWMFEVVTDQKIDEAIFVQAANYVDRVLSNTRIEKTKLQLLGCSCLLLASKLRNYMILSSATLAYLTDGCFTEQQIIKYEVFVLSKLGWDMTPVLATDYLEPIIAQTHLSHLSYVKRHATAFLCMLILYPTSLEYSPSKLAAASIYSALTYIDPQSKDEPNLVKFLSAVIGIKKAELESMKEMIITSMDKELALHEQQHQKSHANAVDNTDGSSSDSGISDSGTYADSEASEGNLIDTFEELNNYNSPIEEFPNNSLDSLTPSDIMDICITE